MNIFPAIDLYEGKAVRLFKGDYAQMTVYSENPVEVAFDFQAQGASYLHLVDLEGAKTGETPTLTSLPTLHPKRICLRKLEAASVPWRPFEPTSVTELTV